MVMLDVLLQLRKKLNFDVQVLHVHHGIRGKESDEDERFVQDFCVRKNIPFFSRRLTGFDRNSSEDALRRARYEVFESFLSDSVNGKLATAHHLDDRLETFLMRLAKGSGIKGLRSIPVRRGPYIRPLLFLTREEIARYAAERQIAWRDDSSNLDEDKLRNKIRLRLTPVLQDVFGREFYAGFAKSLKELDEWYRMYESDNRILFAEMNQPTEEGLSLSIDKYRRLPALRRRRMLEYCISSFYPLNFTIPTGYFAEFDSFVAQARTGALFHFKQQVSALKERDEIVFIKGRPESFPSLFIPEDLSVAENRSFKIRITRLDKAPADFKNPKADTEIICGDRIRFPLEVRGWREGDWFFPLGMNKKQKLSDFFINRKIDLHKKKSLPLLVNKDEIVWVAGYRIDNRYRVTPDCKTIYKLEIKYKS